MKLINTKNISIKSTMLKALSIALPEAKILKCTVKHAYNLVGNQQWITIRFESANNIYILQFIEKTAYYFAFCVCGKNAYSSFDISVNNDLELELVYYLKHLFSLISWP